MEVLEAQQLLNIPLQLQHLGAMATIALQDMCNYAIMAFTCCQPTAVSLYLKPIQKVRKFCLLLANKLMNSKKVSTTVTLLNQHKSLLYAKLYAYTIGKLSYHSSQKKLYSYTNFRSLEKTTTGHNREINGSVAVLSQITISTSQLL